MESRQADDRRTSSTTELGRRNNLDIYRGKLGPRSRMILTSMIQSISIEKADIGKVMIFSLDRAEAAEDVSSFVIY